MKILILMPQLMDWGSSFLLNGFIQLLGANNIDEYPDYSEIAGWLEWMPKYKPRAVSFEIDYEYIKSNITDYKFIILATPDNNSISALRRLAVDCGMANMPPIILADSGDYRSVRYDLINEFEIQIGFKREYDNIRDIYSMPYPFSSAVESTPFYLDGVDKEFDIFYWVGFSHINRLFILHKLLKSGYNINGYCIAYRSIIAFLEKINWQVDKYLTGHSLNYKDYIGGIAASKSIVVSQGYGKDTPKLWEAAGQNTLVFAENNGLEIPYDYQDGYNIVRFNSDLSDLDEKVKYYLGNDSLRQEIIDRQMEHTRMFHTCERRAAYILAEICNIYDVSLTKKIEKIREEQKLYCAELKQPYIEYYSDIFKNNCSDINANVEGQIKRFCFDSEIILTSSNKSDIHKYSHPQHSVGDKIYDEDLQTQEDVWSAYRKEDYSVYLMSNPACIYDPEEYSQIIDYSDYPLIDDWAKWLYDAYGSLHVLDCGCGSGHMGFKYLAYGHRVTFADVSHYGTQFLKWRLARSCYKDMANVVFIDKEPLYWGQYDVLLSWEVLEHVWDVDLTLGDIATMLKDNAICFISTFFDDCNGRDKSHLLHNTEKYNDFNNFLALAELKGFIPYCTDQNNVIKVWKYNNKGSSNNREGKLIGCG